MMKLKAIGCFVVLLIVPTVLFLLSYFVVPGRSQDAALCDMRMQAIHEALGRYADDHDGRYPERLALLHPKYIDLRKVRCPAWQGDRESYETGYLYVPALRPEIDFGPTSPDREPLLFCGQYHLEGHGKSTYRVQFGILLNNGRIVHVRDPKLTKYDGPMRRYPFFRKFPYDDSRPTLELVRSLKERFPEDLEGFVVIDEVEPEPPLATTP